MTRNFVPQLLELADFCRLHTFYQDVNRRRQSASIDSLLAALKVWGCPVETLSDVPHVLAEMRQARWQRAIEPVLVAWDGRLPEFQLHLPSKRSSGRIVCTVQLEAGDAARQWQFEIGQLPRAPVSGGAFVTLNLQLPDKLPLGYHQLNLATPDQTFQSLIISSPREAYQPPRPLRDWGCFLPLHALRTERDWGAGDLADLKALAEWTAELGGGVVGTLPLLASYLDPPCDPSPYGPASRLAWNEFYIDVPGAAETVDCRAAQQLLASPELQAEIGQLRALAHVDYVRLMARKRQVLELLADAFFQQQPGRAFQEFQQFLAQHPFLNDYARFRAAREHHRRPWQQWPAEQRDAARLDFDPRSMRYHQYVQWIMTRQLTDLASATGGGLYLDVPLGVRPDGFDVWRWQEVYATEASAGAPPDAMWTRGQDWCFPPLHPEAIRQQGYQHVRDYMAHQMRFAHLLRVDHVMQFHRLYWIPQGLPADQGVYVGYHADELYAVLNLESHRFQATTIGENLGTVPPAVNEAMDEHSLQRMFIVQYELADADWLPTAESSDRLVLAGVPEGSLASLNTHDMPTFAAWWSGLDLQLRQQLGLLDARGAAAEREALQLCKQRLVRWLERTGWLVPGANRELQIQQALLELLAGSPAGVVLVNLEDLWLETQPQNIPGTGPDRNNWRRKATRCMQQFSQDEALLRALRAVSQRRTG